VQLNVLQEIWDFFDVDSNSVQEQGQSDDVLEQLFLVVSEAVISGKESPRTLKIKGSIQEIEILVLIDSGNSHSFLSDQVATMVQGITVSKRPTPVGVANGNLMQSSIVLSNVEWYLHGHVFHLDLRIMPLQNFDMIIGMDWLERFSSMKIHWAQKWLTIPYSNSQFTLQGLVSGILDCHMIELMQCATEVQSDRQATVPPALQQLLDKYQYVFATTVELPPR
jgi:hypothetical protein